MGSAPPARFMFLGFNEYQWSYIHGLGYKLNTFVDFVSALHDVKRNNKEVKFAHCVDSVRDNIVDIGKHYLIADIVDRNIQAINL